MTNHAKNINFQLDSKNKLSYKNWLRLLIINWKILAKKYWSCLLNLKRTLVYDIVSNYIRLLFFRLFGMNSFIPYLLLIHCRDSVAPLLRKESFLQIRTYNPYLRQYLKQEFTQTKMPNSGLGWWEIFSENACFIEYHYKCILE